MRDHAEEINTNSLVIDVVDFQDQLAARANSVKSRITFLKDQFHARVSGDEPRLYTSLGSEFRTTHGKFLRLTSQSKSMTEETYLTVLLNAMIKEDSDAIGLNANKGHPNPFTLAHIHLFSHLNLISYRAVKRTIYSPSPYTIPGVLQS
jgi:hypothetical protein